MVTKKKCAVDVQRVTAKYVNEIKQLDTKAKSDISLLENKIKGLTAEKRAIYNTMIPKVKHQADMKRFEAKLFGQYQELNANTSAEIAKLETRVSDQTHKNLALHASCASLRQRQEELDRQAKRVPRLLHQISELQYELSAVRKAKTLAQQSHRTVKQQMKELTVRSTQNEFTAERALKKRIPDQIFDAAD